MTFFWTVFPVALSTFALGYLVGYGLRSVLAIFEKQDLHSQYREAKRRDGDVLA